MGQESWIGAHVNAYRHFGGITRILTPDDLKTGIMKNTRDELIINRSYREMAETIITIMDQEMRKTYGKNY